MSRWKTISGIAVAVLLGGLLFWTGHSFLFPSDQPGVVDLPFGEPKPPNRQISPGRGNPAGSTMAADVVRPEVSLVAGISGEWTTAERMRKLRLLPRNLNESECEALANALCEGPDNPGLFALKNDIMNLLRNQQPSWPGLTPKLEAIMADRELHDVVRGYAAQHLRYQYEQSGDAGILEAYRQLMESHPGELAGEVLLAMHSLSRDFPEEIDKTEWRERAVKCVLEEDTNHLARISALNVAALWGAVEILPKAREIAQDTGQELVLRLAAISALGILGADGERAILGKCAETEGVMAMAAKAALEKIACRQKRELKE